MQGIRQGKNVKSVENMRCLEMCLNMIFYVWYIFLIDIKINEKMKK